MTPIAQQILYCGHTHPVKPCFGQKKAHNARLIGNTVQASLPQRDHAAMRDSVHSFVIIQTVSTPCTRCKLLASLRNASKGRRSLQYARQSSRHRWFWGCLALVLECVKKFRFHRFDGFIQLPAVCRCVELTLRTLIKVDFE